MAVDVIDEEDQILRLPSLESQLAAWIEAIEEGRVRRNVWLKRGGFQLYVRRSERIIGQPSLIMLDIASLSVPRRFQSRGWFKQFRRVAESLNPWDATYYEAVVNDQLDSYFRRGDALPAGENSFYVLTPRGSRKSHL